MGNLILIKHIDLAILYLNSRPDEVDICLINKLAQTHWVYLNLLRGYLLYLVKTFTVRLILHKLDYGVGFAIRCKNSNQSVVIEFTTFSPCKNLKFIF